MIAFIRHLANANPLAFGLIVGGIGFGFVLYKCWTNQEDDDMPRKKPAPTHYCSYCRYYGTNPITSEVDPSKDFLGTKAAVVRHADKHPIGDPRDMAIEIAKADR